MTADRFGVRRRADGWAVWDADERRVLSTHATEARATWAAKQADADAAEQEYTYGVTWYVEVDATSEAEAVAKARKFLLPTWRENWDPLSVEVFEPDGSGDFVKHVVSRDLGPGS